MIEPVRGIDAFDVSCAGCGEVTRIEHRRFGHVVARLKATGWRIVGGQKGWTHKCPGCREEAAAA